MTTDASGPLVGSATPPADLLHELPAWLRLVRAPNPGPMTLEGTNTWVLRRPRADESIVIDPGPLDTAHLRAVAGVAAARRVVVVTTHGHHDHTAGLERFLQICPGAQLWDVRAPVPPVTTAGLGITVMPTPGHTADSVTFLVEVDGTSAAFTGDTILGRGTTVVAYPDGDLGHYLASVRHLETLGPVPVLPGHGPALADCAAAARHYLGHRLARLEQVRQARAAGARTEDDVIRLVYAGVDAKLWPAARWSVRAQLAYLDRESIDRESTGAPARLDPP